MKLIGTIFVTIGAFMLAAVVLAYLGPTLHSLGIPLSGHVSSVPWTVVIGGVLLAAGLRLR